MDGGHKPLRRRSSVLASPPGRRSVSRRVSVVTMVASDGRPFADSPTAVAHGKSGELRSARSFSLPKKQAGDGSVRRSQSFSARQSTAQQPPAARTGFALTEAADDDDDEAAQAYARVQRRRAASAAHADADGGLTPTQTVEKSTAGAEEASPAAVAAP